MNGLKLTIDWNFNGQGWSESWYNATTALPQKADDPVVYNFVQARNSVTAGKVQMVGYTVTDLANPRTTLAWSSNPSTTSGPEPDVPSNSWYYMAKPVGNRGSRQVWLRGLADDWIQWDPSSGRFIAVGTFQSRVNKFRDALLAGPWGMKCVKPLKTTAFKAPVDSIAAGPIGGSTKLVGAATGSVIEQPLIVSGFKKPLSVLNGTYQWRSGWYFKDADIVLTSHSLSAQKMSLYAGGGMVRTPEYEIKQVISFTPKRPGERKVGKPIGVQAGRQSKR